MVNRLVITIDMDVNVVKYLRNIPGPGVKLINRIISEIDSDKKIKLIRHQVLVVLGKLNEQKSVNRASKLLNWSVFWNYSYITYGTRPKVSKLMDKAVCAKIEKAIREMLWVFYSE